MNINNSENYVITVNLDIERKMKLTRSKLDCKNTKNLFDFKTAHKSPYIFFYGGNTLDEKPSLEEIGKLLLKKEDYLEKIQKFIRKKRKEGCEISEILLLVEDIPIKNIESRDIVKTDRETYGEADFAVYIELYIL